MSNVSDNTVLPVELLGKADELIKGLSKNQLVWLGGYLSGLGLQDGHSETAPIEVEEQQSAQTNLTILVGSHSGNSKIVANSIVEQAAANNVKAKVVDMADYKVKQLKEESNILVIVSTHGEGEPPVAAEDLHRLIDTKRAGDLSGVSFAVIAMGDSSYKYFCQTGIDFHERLQKRGAQSLAEPILLDVDFQDHLDDVVSNSLSLFGSKVASASPAKSSDAKIKVHTNSIYQAEVLEKVKLNGKGSNKETYHVELSLEDSGLEYQPGDSLEVYAVNDSKLVKEVIAKLGLDENQLVQVNKEELTLIEALQYHREITVVTLPVVKKLSAYVGESDLNTLLDNIDELDAYLDGRDLLDLLYDFQLELNAQQLVDALRPLVPRAYSISSSQAEVGEEVHLTVGAVRYEKNDRLHEGACSVFLADRIEVEEKVGVRVKQNDGFKLPAEDKPIIMIGPGTGIAPFRSFIQERAEQDASGKNWLFFGDQHFETDFLYQAEWLKYRSSGVLNQIDVAFSRDQEEKVYVQHRLLQKAREIYQWIQDGAYIYVCGDQNSMAKDVRAAFIQILQSEGGLTPEEAEEQLLAFRKENRYQEDVY
ncbi:assimilatory sulfite reductase (NADPH) flavoprotein subunit [Carboxylicivirga linearis]|uniref:Assimilatory sulfite reductase (NADPH) flavoprotein subunit n=1 Tax=Carboxylicivirga linearis TaxID=1628157 RepID=A0ABS5K1K1_9BACT|nr:assimilatory sulfite reductase (NADPH) flavoprotein subunit [Carboxylicivirga linearis]MBS2101003.1 assimilatory sulfite reductase (NADPH) flavoprotein subunit [Carboxylicivirga linearis]